MSETPSLSEQWETHTWNNDRCEACGELKTSHAAIRACDPERRAKGLAMLDYHPYPTKHKRSCIDDEGKIECVCGLSESMDLYDESVAERAFEFRPEEA